MVTFLVVSSLGKLVVVALSVPDSLVQAFFVVAFLSQLLCVLGVPQTIILAYTLHVIRLLAVLASLAEISRCVV